MFSKAVIALLTATMFTAPVLAQGVGATKAQGTAPKAPITATAPVAKPAVIAPVAGAPAKVIKKTPALKRHAGRHLKRVAHVKRHKLVKQVRHIKRSRVIRTTLRTSSPRLSMKAGVRTGIN